LNQRHFASYVSGTPVISDAQADIQRCLEPGTEVIIFRGVEELNEINVRIRREPSWALAVGEAGRRRVLAHHTYSNRLQQIAGHFDRR
jgi:spore maturation protein CgeB